MAKNYSKYVVFLCLFSVFNFLDYHNLGDVFRQGKYRYMFLSLVPILFIYLKDRLHWGVAFYAAWLLLSFTLNDYPVSGVMSMFLSFGTIAFALFMMEVCEARLARWLVLFGLFQGGLAALQYFGIHLLFTPAEEWGRYLPVGTYGHNTVLGPFLACCVAPALWHRRWGVALFLSLVCLGCKSTMTVASLGAVYAIYLWYRTSWDAAFHTSMIALLALLIGFWLTPEEHHVADYFYSLNGREVFWAAGWRAFLESPWFGGGPGTWGSYYSMKYIGVYQGNMRVLQLHNDYLEYLVEYGCVPFLVLLYALYGFVREFKPTWMGAVCAALLVNALGNFTFQIVPLALLFIVCLTHCSNDNKEIVL